LQNKGCKEYFRAYVYLYTSICHVQQLGSTAKAVYCLNIAINQFDLAKFLMQTSDVCYLDLTMMHNFVHRRYITLGYIEKSFAEKEYSKYSVGAKHFLFRIMVVTMYWENKFQPFPLSMIVTRARDMAAKVSNGHCYRSAILTSIVLGLEVSYNHTRDNPADFPPIKVIQDNDARSYWNKEKANVCTITKFIPTTGPVKRAPPTAESILAKCKLAEQVYAFGYQITETWTIFNPV
jgi:hypothetical protein